MGIILIGHGGPGAYRLMRYQQKKSPGTEEVLFTYGWWALR